MILLNEQGKMFVRVGLAEARKVLLVQKLAAEQQASEAETKLLAIQKSIAGIDAALELLEGTVKL